MNVSEALSYFVAEIIRALVRGRYQQSNQAIDCEMDAAHQGHQISGDANESQSLYTKAEKETTKETHRDRDTHRQRHTETQRRMDTWTDTRT